MSILSHNGSALIAMCGKNCVAIAADRRLGTGGQTLSTDWQKIFEFGPNLYLGFSGLATDIMTVAERMKFRVNLYELRENRRMKPKTLLSAMCNLLYERRFGPYFVEPVVAGIDPVKNEPFIGTADLIGCPMVTKDFVVGGTANEQLYGMCESLWTKDMDPEALFQCISQALLNACDRDALSGWGAIVHIIEKDKVTTRTLAGRMD